MTNTHTSSYVRNIVQPECPVVHNLPYKLTEKSMCVGRKTPKGGNNNMASMDYRGMALGIFSA